MSNNSITVLGFVICSFAAFGQQLITTNKVTDDSISIKWIPKSFEEYKIIVLNSARVSRIATAKKEDYSILDYSEAEVWNISETKTRFDKLDASNVEQQKQIALIEPVYEKDLPKELVDFTFGAALSENVISPDFQFVLGNIVVDKSFNKKESYVYKIEIEGFDNAYVYIDPKDKTIYPPIENVALTIDKKKTTELTWNKKEYEKEAFGYDIEHSMDKEKEGSFLNTLPFIPFSTDQQINRDQASYRDNPEPGHFHFYRIHGIDLFGHRSLLSEWKKIYVPLLVNAWVEIDTLYAAENDRVIEGSIHTTSRRAAIKEVLLLRSAERDGLYQTMQSIHFQDSAVSFKVQEKETGDHYYYKLALTNKDDSVYSVPRYLFTLDQKPPNPPTELSGKIDSSGIVELTWTPSDDDDIKGYRVYRANTKREEFIEITSRFATGTHFTDTLALDNLTSEIYYCMSATDLNYNKSINSDTILLIKPDTIAPIPCVLKEVIMMDTLLKVVWTNSDSQDLQMNSLLRKSKGIVDTVYQWMGTESSYKDTDITPGTNYTYSILSLDKSDNPSLSGTYAKFYEPGYRKPLMNVNAKANTEEKFVALSWDKPKDKVYSYQIFRTKEGGKLSHLKTISDASVVSLQDKNVRINNKYLYSVKYVNQDGIHSIPAKAEVIYQ